VVFFVPPVTHGIEVRFGQFQGPGVTGKRFFLVFFGRREIERGAKPPGGVPGTLFIGDPPLFFVLTRGKDAGPKRGGGGPKENAGFFIYSAKPKEDMHFHWVMGGGEREKQSRNTSQKNPADKYRRDARGGKTPN